MPSVNDYLMRSSQYPPHSNTGNQVNTSSYYRYQAGGTQPLLQHSHGLLANSSTPTSDSMGLTEMSIVNSHMEPNNYYSTTNASYGPDQNALLRHGPPPPTSDLMTNAFTYNVNTSGANRMYPVSGDFVTLNATSSNGRTYTEVCATDELSHHVAALGPMVNCIDSLSSSTSDKTAEVDDEWRILKHHPLAASRNAQTSHMPYIPYNGGGPGNNEVSQSTHLFHMSNNNNVIVSPQSYISAPNGTSSSPSQMNQVKVQFSNAETVIGSPHHNHTSVTSV